LFGYPYIDAWDAHTTSGKFDYGSYDDMRAFIESHSGGTLPDVKKVRIIADGSASTPYTTVLTNVRYAGHDLTK
jgi:hypothetical protein